MSLTFHIIYTAETVKPLQLLLYSLLKWSDCTFCLVANGCSSTEKATLQRLCASNPRLSYVTLPTQKVIRRGEALNHLQEQNQTEFPDLPQDRASPIGQYMSIQKRVYIWTTFFAIYNNPVLTEIRRATGIDFISYRWATIPEPYQKQAEAMGAKRAYYDAGKLLNLMLHLNGHVLQHQPCPALRHIGGLSHFSGTQPRAWWRRWRAWGGRWRRKLAGQKMEQPFSAETPYLSKLLRALADNQAVPTLPAAHAIPDHARVAHTTAELVALHAEFAK